jgi:predicted RNase H-like HicB family nuclease
VLARYIDVAMETAHYEIIKDRKPYYREVPELPGVWATGSTLEECRRELREVVSDWIALRLRLGLEVPVLAGIDLNRIAYEEWSRNPEHREAVQELAKIAEDAGWL